HPAAGFTQLVDQPGEAAPVGLGGRHARPERHLGLEVAERARLVERRRRAAAASDAQGAQDHGHAGQSRGDPPSAGQQKFNWALASSLRLRWVSFLFSSVPNTARVWSLY